MDESQMYFALWTQWDSKGYKLHDSMSEFSWGVMKSFYILSVSYNCQKVCKYTLKRVMITVCRFKIIFNNY